MEKLNYCKLFNVLSNELAYRRRKTSATTLKFTELSPLKSIILIVEGRKIILTRDKKTISRYLINGVNAE